MQSATQYRLRNGRRVISCTSADDARAKAASAPGYVAEARAMLTDTQPAECWSRCVLDPDALELEITDATQYATLYRGGEPIATLQRRRVLEKRGPVWRAFDLQGVLVRNFYTNAPADRLAALTFESLERRK